MALNVICSNCNAMLSAPEQAAGKSVRCPKCSTTTAVPVAHEVAEGMVVNDGFKKVEDSGKQVYAKAKDAAGSAATAFSLLFNDSPAAVASLTPYKILQAGIVLNSVFILVCLFLMREFTSSLRTIVQLPNSLFPDEITFTHLLVACIPTISFFSVILGLDLLNSNDKKTVRYERYLFCAGAILFPMSVTLLLIRLLGMGNLEVAFAFSFCAVFFYYACSNFYSKRAGIFAA